MYYKVFYENVKDEITFERIIKASSDSKLVNKVVAYQNDNIRLKGWEKIGNTGKVLVSYLINSKGE